MQVRRLSTTAELALWREPWRRLTRGVPFRDWAWLESWWHAYGGELYVLAVHDPAGRLAGLVPWRRERSATNGRVLRFLGDGAACTDYLTVLCEPTDETAVVAAVADWLCRTGHADAAPRDRWDVLRLEGVVECDTLLQTLLDRLESAGMTVRREAGLHCWPIALPGDWSTYVESLSKSNRKLVRRVESRLLATGRARLTSIAAADELPGAMATFIDLHQRRRISLGEPGCFADARFGRFLHAATRSLWEAGQLELDAIVLDDHVIAAQYHLTGGGVTYAYQSGIDPARLGDDPGRLMAVVALQRAIAQGRTHYDFLRGDEPYKRFWLAEPVATCNVRVIPNRALAHWRHNVWLAGTTVKRWLKHGRRLIGRTRANA